MLYFTEMMKKEYDENKAFYKILMMVMWGEKSMF